MSAESYKMTDSQIAYWKRAISSARQKREEISETYGWKDNLERYLPKPAKKRTRGKTSADINPGVDFSDVERKKAALLFDTPFIALTADNPELAGPVALHQELLNGILGPRHANVKPTSLKAIFNCLCTSGVGPVMVGYQATVQEIKAGEPLIDPATGQPAVDPMTGAPALAPQNIPVPIAEKFFVSGISPKALLIPAEFRDTDFQRAPWLGYEWAKPLSQVKREYKLPKDWKPSGSGAASDKKIHFETDNETEHEDIHEGDPLVSGQTIWYRCELDPEKDRTMHPDLLKECVFVEGEDQPVVWEESQHQTLGPDGRMTPDSLIGFQLRPLVLRDVADSAWVPSDCAVTGPLTKEVIKYRSQVIGQRDGNRQIIFHDPEKIPSTTLDKVKAAHGVVWIPVPPGSLDSGQNGGMMPGPTSNLGRENWEGQSVIQRDREQILGIGANQVGAQTTTRRTASEVNTIQRNTEARFEQERARVTEWYLDIARAMDALVLRYADEKIATQILGQQKAQAWVQSKQQLAGGYQYEIQMDSGKYQDVEADRRQFMQLYNMIAKNPLVNQQFVVQEMARKFGYDPSQFIAQPKPPQPEPPKWNLSVQGEDLNPYSPQYVNIVAALKAQGVDTTGFLQPAAVDPLQAAALGAKAGGPVGPGVPLTPGPADKAERLDQHNLDQTGAIPGPKGIQ